MSIQEIPLDSTAGSERLQVEVEGVLLEIRTRWVERRSGWYVDIKKIEDDGETVLGRGFRIRDSSAPLTGLGRLQIPGELVARGPADYDRDDLGDSLGLYYIPEDRLA
jgi:hypothetical protein